MKKITILTFLILFCTNGFGQALTWGRSNGSTGNEYGRSVFVDGAGGVYTVGSFEGTVDFDPGAGVSNLTSAGGSDIFIQKLNSSGAFVFAKRVGSGGNDVAFGVAVDPSNLIYITGSFMGTVDFDPGAGVSNLTSAGSTDAFILRLTSAGNWSYSNRFGSTGDDVGLSVCANSGAFALTGTFSNIVDFDPGAGVTNLGILGITQGFIARFTSGTSFTFASLLGISGNASQMDASGNIYTTGVTTISLGNNDAFVTKMGPTGTIAWTKYLGGATGDGGYGINIDASSNVFTTGYFSGTGDFDPGAGTANLVSGGSNDIYVSKLDVDGNYLWAAGFAGTGDDRGLSIDTDTDGNVYTSGYYRNTVDFDPGAGTVNIASGGLIDGFMSKLDANGDYVWAHKVGSTGNDALLGMMLDASYNIHFAGYFSGTVDVDPTATTTNIVSAGGADFMVVKWAPCGTPAAPTNTTALADMTVCSGNSTTLTGSGTGTLGWYTLSTGGTYLGGGGSYNTGALTATTVFFLQDSSCVAGSRTQITVFVAPAIANQTVTVTDATVCSGASTTVNITSSETGISYYLRNDSDNSIVAGPEVGTGSSLSLSTGAISSTTTYNINAFSSLPNYALDLDGTNDYVDLSNNNRGITNAITVSAKIRTTVTGGSQFIVDKYLSAGIGYYLLVSATGYASFQGRDVAGGIKSSGNSTTLVADNQWHDITGVVRSTGWEIWVDGVLESSGAYSLGGTGLGTTAGLLVGQFNGTYCPADIDRVAIWNSALSPSTITLNSTSCLTGSETNLVGYFSFNEGNGTTALDLSPSAINGTLTNMSVPACWISGSVESCPNGCELEMGNTVTVTVSAPPSAPTISAGGPTTFCPGGSVTLTSSAGSSYLWSTGETTSSIVVSGAGTYTVQVTNAAGCQSVASAGTVVTIGTTPSQPTISTGGTTTFCAGGLVTLTSSAGTSYLWSNGATTPSINATTGGTYTVQVTNASGCQSVASAGTTVTVNALPAQPTISAGGATTFCDGGSVSLTSSAGTTYLWSTGATTAAINPTTSGTYTVQVTNAAGCQSVASTGTTVTVNSLPAQPTISAGGATTFCDGGSVSLTSSAGTSYLWSTGATTAAINPTTSGTYTVQVTNAAGCQSVASAGTTVTVNALPAQPTISAGGPTTFCDGGSVSLTSSAGTSYFWSNGASATSTNITTSGNYTVQVTNAFGCLSIPSAATVVTVNAVPSQPTISAGGATTFCDGGSVSLTSSAGTSYLWSTGATTAAINPTTSGTYTVQVTNAAGCQSVASTGTTVTVNALPTQPTISAGGATTFCDGGSVSLTSSAGTSYLWSTGATTAAINPTTSGTYTVQVTNAAGCQSVASTGTDVTVNPLPVITTGNILNPTSCLTGNGEIEVLGSGTGNLSWSGTATGSLTGTTLPTTVSGLINGSYQITFTDANGCTSNMLSNTLSAPSAPPAPSITAGGSTTFCAGGSVTLSSSSGTTYQWSTGETTPSIIVSIAGDYTVSINDASGCSSPASSITTVTVNALPVIATGTLTDPSTCTTSDGSIEITGTGTGDLSWSGTASGSATGVTLPYTISGLANGSYTVDFTDASGCTSTAVIGTLTLPSAPPAPVVTSSGSTTLCEGDEVTLTSTTGDNYLWSNGAVTQSIVVDAAGSYSLNVTDASGCTSPTSNVVDVVVNPVPVASASVAGITLTASPSGANYVWIDCSDDQPVAGETAIDFTPTANGSYAVIVTLNGCSDTSACQEISTIGLDELGGTLTVGLYPNPTNDEVKVVSNGVLEHIEVCNLQGEKIMETANAQFSVGHLPSGVYMVQIQCAEGTKIIRLVRH